MVPDGEAQYDARLKEISNATRLLQTMLPDLCAALDPIMVANPLKIVTMTSIMKIDRMHQSIVALTKELFYEEIWILLRPLIELVINTVYFQLKPEALTNFINYDAISDSQWNEGLDGITDFKEHLSNKAEQDEFGDELKDLADTARQAGAFKAGKLRSWTETLLPDRAIIADKVHVSGGPQHQFTIYYRLIVKQADAYVHVSHRSLSFYQDLYLGNHENMATKRRDYTLRATITSLQVVHGFCVAMWVRHRLPHHPLSKELFAITNRLSSQFGNTFSN